MKTSNRIVLAALFLLAGAGTGLRAATPENAILKLPEISKELAELAPKINLSAVIVDGSGKPVPGGKGQALTWSEGRWSKSNDVTQMQFPLKDIKNPQDPELCYKLDYSVAAKPSVPGARASECLPIRSGEDFTAAAALPLDLVYIDASKLQWGTDARRGLLKVSWSISRNTKSQQVYATGNLDAKEAQGAGTLASKTEPLSANIFFYCASRPKVIKIDWADNNKDLRKLPGGLRITLTQPVCPGTDRGI